MRTNCPLCNSTDFTMNSGCFDCGYITLETLPEAHYIAYIYHPKGSHSFKQYDNYNEAFDSHMEYINEFEYTLSPDSAYELYITGNCQLDSTDIHELSSLMIVECFCGKDTCEIIPAW